MTKQRREPSFTSEGGRSRLHLSMAVERYDHLADLTGGLIRPEGIELTPMHFPVEEIFHRFVADAEWDISEMSFAKYLSLTDEGEAPMVGLPVFPSRVFRHSSIYVASASPMAGPADLAGKTIGVPEWVQTAGIYARGILQDQYGLDLTSAKWVQAGVNEAGRKETATIRFPGGIRYTQRADANLNDLLLAGEIDAIVTARAPRSFTGPDSPIRRLIADTRAEEEAWFAHSRVFPIMHLITVRREVLDRFPWVAANLLTAFTNAKDASLARMRDVTHSGAPIPWIASIAEDATEKFGADFWPYGVEPNRPTLDAFCRYCHEQGVTTKRLVPDDLFPERLRNPVRV